MLRSSASQKQLVMKKLVGSTNAMVEAAAFPIEIDVDLVLKDTKHYCCFGSTLARTS